MEIWYKVTGSKHGERVAPVVVERQTDSSIWIKGRRRNKKSAWEQYYPTAEQAFNALKRRCSNSIEQHKNSIKREEEELNELHRQESEFNVEQAS